jgi:hypothetical protein
MRSAAVWVSARNLAGELGGLKRAAAHAFSLDQHQAGRTGDHPVGLDGHVSAA